MIMELHGTILQKLLIIVIELHIKASGIEFILNSTNWIEAHKECIGLGGKLQTENDIGSCNSKIVGRNIWTGTYQLLSPWLGKSGCFDLSNTPVCSGQHSSVQDCYRLCGKTYFGYNKNNYCFCYKNIDNRTSISSSVCSAYVVPYTNAWIYRTKALNIRNADDLKAGVNCVGARCENGRTILEVKHCTDLRIPFCESGTNSIDPQSWIGADEWCINNHDYLVFNHEGICKNTHEEHKSFLYWTGYKRYWYNAPNVTRDNKLTLRDVSNCSYIRCPNNELTLGNTVSSNTTFQGNCSNTLDGYACLIDIMAEITPKEGIEISTTRRTSLSNVSSSVSQHLRSSSFQGTWKRISYKLTSNSPPRQTRRKQTELHTRGISDTIYTASFPSKQIVSGYSSGSTTLDSTTTGILKSSSKVHSYDVLIAVLTVSAFAFVISIAVVVVCRLRRQGPFRSKGLKSDTEMMEMHDPNYHDFNNIPYNGPTTLHSNTAYDTHNIAQSRNSDQTSRIKQSTSNDQYSIVMKSIPETTESRLDKREEISFDIKDNEYDRLNDIKDRGRNDSNNIYDSSSGLRDKDDPTYNTTSQMDIRRRDGTANIYDSSSGLRYENDPTYNTTSDMHDKNNRDNSVYDHV